MKKIKAIKNIIGENLPLEKMNIQFVGKDYVVANFIGFGFTKTYAPWNGYTVEFENN